MLVEGIFILGMMTLLTAVSVIDARRQIIPNYAVGALLAGGLLQSHVLGVISPVQALAGALTGGLVFYIAKESYRLLRNVDGLGMGDVKFMVAAGSWVGLQGIPILVLLATVSALLMISTIHLTVGGLTQHTRIAFGPHLSTALFATWFCLLLGYI